MLKKTVQDTSVKWFKVFLFMFTVLATACGQNAVVKDTGPMPFGVNKIAVFPFEDMAGVYGENVNARCPVCGAVFVTGEVSEDTSRMLTEQLFVFLENRKDTELIPAGQSNGVMSGLTAENKKDFSKHDLWIETGRALGADAVLVGFLYRFRKRVGTKYSAEVPASVAFGLHLIRVDDGRLLWSGHFDETQQSLFNNLYHIDKFFKRKGEWITAREMAESGLKDVLKTFPASVKPKSEE